MPSSITHELIADCAMKQGGFPIGAPEYYFLGAQGPDIFFFLKPLSAREYNLGKLLHRRRVYEWFCALKDALPAGETREKCLSYALGFCSHLAADAVFHPFVYRYLEATGAPHSAHQRIENDWDVYFLHQMRGGEVQNYAFPFDLDAIAKEGVLYDYLAPAFAQFRENRVTDGDFRRMLRRFSMYLSHFHSGKKVLAAVGLGALYPADEADETFLRGTKFEAIAGRARAEELFDDAVRESITRMKNFLSALRDVPLDRDLFSRHLLTGERLE